MKILAISIGIPGPEKKGDQAVAFFRLMHLVKVGHTVEVVCFGDLRKIEDQRSRRVLEESGIVVNLVDWKIWVAAVNIIDAIARTRLPFQCALYKSTLFGKMVNEVSCRISPDIIYCVMVRVVPNVAGFKGRLFVEMIDSMWLNFSRRSALSRWPMRWLLNIEKNRVRKYEKAVADRSEHSFVVSNIDRDAIGSEKVHVIPLGVDMLRFAKNRHVRNQPVIVFTGNMHYQPNVDAVIWFVRNCWGRIKKFVPNVHFVIAGSNPKTSVISLSSFDPSISVTGRVASIGDILNQATVAIAPMQSGSGMQFKILEAMACGIPVITTTLGLGDIAAHPGRDLIVADTSDCFGENVVKLLTSLELNKSVGECGFQYVLEKHNWDAVNELFLIKSGLSKSISI